MGQRFLWLASVLQRSEVGENRRIIVQCPSMHIAVPHKMSASQAVGRIKSMLNEHRGTIMQQAKITQEEWKGNTLHFAVEIQKKPVVGTLATTENEYVLDATLPFLWRIFEGKIEKEIKKQVEGMAR